MSGPPAGERIPYDFAVLRLVPHVHLSSFVNVGVVLHARTAGFLDLRALTDAADIAARAPEVDAERVARYLRTYRDLCRGRPEAGPVALDPPSERFHWLTAPRSDVLQPSTVHGGLSLDPAATLEALFRTYVGDG